jgi:hypothetical protein
MHPPLPALSKQQSVNKEKKQKNGIGLGMKEKI